MRSDVYVHYFLSLSFFFFFKMMAFGFRTFGPQEKHYARLVPMKRNGDRQQQWEVRGEAAVDIRNPHCVFVLTLCVA